MQTKPTVGSARPALVKEWHPTKNGKLTPNDVTLGSGRRVWWRCKTDPSHEWHTVVISRAIHNTGCPMCLGRQASQSNSFETDHPDAANEWHPTKNGDLKAADVLSGSTRVVWWRCAKNSRHSWRASISERAHGAGCPVCSGVLPAWSSSLKATHPKLSDEWHETSNGSLVPTMVTAQNEEPVWWRCAKDPAHVWEEKISVRALQKRGCPQCTGEDRVPQWRRIEELQASARDTRRAARPPAALFKRLTPDEQESLYRHRVREETEVRKPAMSTSGPITAVRQRAKAPLDPKLQREWHPTWNAGIDPNSLAMRPNEAVWWRCTRDSEHAWRASLYERLNTDGGCPLCAAGIKLGS